MQDPKICILEKLDSETLAYTSKCHDHCVQEEHSQQLKGGDDTSRAGMLTGSLPLHNLQHLLEGSALPESVSTCRRWTFSGGGSRPPRTTGSGLVLCSWHSGGASTMVWPLPSGSSYLWKFSDRSTAASTCNTSPVSTVAREHP